MFPTNIIYRTFFIRAACYGTAFTLDVDGQEFLITASHLLEGKDDVQRIRVLRDRQWYDFKCTLVGVGRGDIDVAVLKLPCRLTDPGFELQAQFGGSYIGEDVFFAGYPYNMFVDYGPHLDGQPGAFLKKGVLSAYVREPSKTIYIDALNNEGFSGAAVYRLPGGDLSKLSVIGVVSKYKVEYEAVIDAGGESTKMKVAYNTGFLVAYDIAHALELARK